MPDKDDDKNLPSLEDENEKESAKDSELDADKMSDVEASLEDAPEEQADETSAKLDQDEEANDKDEDEEEEQLDPEEKFEAEFADEYDEEERGEVEHETDDKLGITVPAEPWTSKVRFFGLLVIVIFFGGFGFWSYFAPLESAAITSGKVTVAGNRRTIQHLEGGIIKKLYIKEGSQVNKGQVLIKLDDTQPLIALQLSRSEVIELSAIEARLIAERDNAKKIEFSNRLLKEYDDPRVRRIMNSQERIFKANTATFDGNVDILKQRVIQLQEQIKGIEAQVKSINQQHKLIMEEVQSVRALEAKKLIERPKLLELMREAAKLEGVRGENLSEISVLKQKIGETKAQILTLVSTRRKETLSELRDVQQKLADELEKERSAQDILSRTAIRSPQDGKVVGLKVHTIGGVIKPGDSIMDVVPSKDALVIEARVSPLDIDVVHKGLLARVQLTAYKQRSTPSLEGVVTRVSADIFQDQQSGESYYNARISIKPEEMKKLKDVVLYPGMPAQVMIITEKRTPFEYFTQPIKDSFNRAFREQ